MLFLVPISTYQIWQCIIWAGADCSAGRLRSTLYRKRPELRNSLGGKNFDQILHCRIWSPSIPKYTLSHLVFVTSGRPGLPDTPLPEMTLCNLGGSSTKRDNVKSGAYQIIHPTAHQKRHCSIWYTRFDKPVWNCYEKLINATIDKIKKMCYN